MTAPLKVTSRGIVMSLLTATALIWGFPDATGEQISLREILRPYEGPRVVNEPVLSPRPNVSDDKLQNEPATVFLSMTEIVEDLEIHVQRRISNEGRLVLNTNDSWGPVAIPEGASWKVVTDHDFRPDHRGRWSPVVTLMVDGEPRQTRRLALSAGLYREVLVTRQRLDRGETPRPASVGAVERDIYLERGNPVPASEDLSGYVTVRALTEGQLLGWGDLIRRPLVKRGEVVEVSVEQGRLRIRMRAQAMEDGALGDIVTLRNMQSRREFQGLVEAPNLVSVAL